MRGVLGPPITSLDNALVKRASSLHLRKSREREGSFLVEGADLVEAGLTCGHVPEAVFVVADRPVAARVPADPTFADLPLHAVDDRVAAKITTLETAPDVMGVFALPPPVDLEALRGADPLIVYADRVADPGNMGTLVRAAAGFGATALVTSPGTVDLWSPKVVRAGMGAGFSLPLGQSVTLPELVARVGECRVVGLVAHGGVDLRGAGIDRPVVLCVGAERAGLSAQTETLLTDRVTIVLAKAVPAAVESLNAGVAGAIALYELSRRGDRVARGEGGCPRAPEEG